MSRFHSLAFGILLVAGVLLYGRTLPFPFVFDDHIYLVGNPLVKDARSFTFNGDFRAFATYSARAGLDPDLSTNFILRPVTYLTFYINYALDGLRPQGYRAVNIAIHCANAMLVLLILSHLLRASPKAGTVTSFSAGFIALAAALLFMVHPLQTESVTYIIQRFTSLSAFFYLLTILTYLLANASEKRTARWSWHCLSVAALVLGMLSKEILFTAPFLLVLLDWLVMGAPLKVVWKRTIPYFLCLPIIPALILVTSWAQNNGSANLAAAFHIATAVKDPHYQWHYALTQPGVLLSYLQLIFAPTGLNMDRDYPLATSLWQGRVHLPAALIGGIVAASALWYRHRRDDVRVSLIFCSVLWFFLTPSPSSSVIPLGDLMVEHRTYLASIGALAALVCGADLLRTTWFSNIRWMRYAIPGCVAAWVVVLGAATWGRNDVWSSEVSIWRDTATKSPNKFRPWINLGTACAESGNLQEGASYFRKALYIEPRLIPAYENLGAIENALGHFQEALNVSNVGLVCAPESFVMQYNRGVSCCALGRVEKGILSFQNAIKIRPAHLPSQLALALCYGKLRQYDKALKHGRIAVSLAPANPQVRQALSQIETLVRLQDHASVGRLGE